MDGRRGFAVPDFAAGEKPRPPCGRQEAARMRRRPRRTGTLGRRFGFVFGAVFVTSDKTKKMAPLQALGLDGAPIVAYRQKQRQIRIIVREPEFVAVKLLARDEMRLEAAKARQSDTDRHRGARHDAF